MRKKKSATGANENDTSGPVSPDIMLPTSEAIVQMLNDCDFTEKLIALFHQGAFNLVLEAYKTTEAPTRPAEEVLAEWGKEILLPAETYIRRNANQKLYGEITLLFLQAWYYAHRIPIPASLMRRTEARIAEATRGAELPIVEERGRPHYPEALGKKKDKQASFKAQIDQAEKALTAKGSPFSKAAIAQETGMTRQAFHNKTVRLRLKKYVQAIIDRHT